MNRFDRITAIWICLQSRKLVTAQQLAERFEVSIRTIYRDVRTLEEAGVPIVSEAGYGYSLVDGYRLPPVMFSPQEALSFVAAEKLMENFTDKALGAYHRSAMDKIRAVLKNNEKELLSRLENHIQINPLHAPINDSLPETLDILLRGISENKIVTVDYQSFHSDEPVERDIEPVGVFHEYEYWYVIGYCHLRRAYRQFRADRMHDIRLTDRNHTRKHGELEEYRKPMQTEVAKTEVVIEVKKDAHRYIKDRARHFGFVSERDKGEVIEMVFHIQDLMDGFPRWFLMFADKARIIKPGIVKKRIRELVGKMSENLE
ncbi:helix-turn-helix transcriptional regulator [Negadavirga shengliensis]|uniref:Helix-turn-helix transcriptional regulator n=1 Tax=Negadavirga shengliensis TaxID=1389218 RepID=A0ABV9SZN8_9BACT